MSERAENLQQLQQKHYKQNKDKHFIYSTPILHVLVKHAHTQTAPTPHWVEAGEVAVAENLGWRGGGGGGGEGGSGGWSPFTFWIGGKVGGSAPPPLRIAINIHSMKLFNNLIKNTLLAAMFCVQCTLPARLQYTWCHSESLQLLHFEPSIQ